MVVKSVTGLQTMLAVVVSIGWIAVVLIPAVTNVQIGVQIQIGVQAAMMTILGAIFGISLVKRSNGNGGGK